MSRTVKILLCLAAAGCIAIVSFAGGVLLGGYSPPADENFRAVEDAWRIITQDYIDAGSLDKAALSQAAIEAMMEFVDDPYSSYLDSEAYHSGLYQLEGKYEGIGAEVSMIDEQVVVIAPYSGSPAEVAGIQPGDIITAVEGENITGMSLMEVVLKVRGPQGTVVNLTILRPDTGRTLDIDVERGEVYERSVDFEMTGDYAYIEISQFAENTNKELGDVLKEADSQGAVGIILDLRNNPGGLVDTVVDVASRFIERGVVFTVEFSDGKTEIYEVNKQSPTTSLPMVVLVNGFSASGSEVIAGAMQDHDRAVVAGSTTFGKGSVNVLTQIGSDQGMYITIARWLTPDGHMIEGRGITPDEELTLYGEDLIDWAIDYLENR
ncbi:MAG: S41 family peptidase [Dehalococcoidaceae bacterium]|nr:S41 family peptidase [Dehalococcoidaceae bacterium]